MNALMNAPPTTNPPVSLVCIPTHFAPAGRDTAAEFERKEEIIGRAPLLMKVLDAMPDMVMILNRNRQIVAANKKLLAVLNACPRQLTEKRPGEAVHCIRSNEGPDGCGTGIHCATCGAVQAIIESLTTNKESIRECRILTQTPTEVVPLDLRVTSTPLDVEAEHFVFVAVEDISQEKRVAVLQRAFFHDVLHTAGCIQGYADHLAEETVSDPAVFQRLRVLANQLTEEISSQQDLLLAESGQLNIQPTPVKVKQVLDNLCQLHADHAVATERNVVVGQTWDGILITDRALLTRVLDNMLKNALEATPSGGTVTLTCEQTDNEVTFAVNNPGVIPRDVQLQIFQRSFSTKGEPGRGLGTYSMKLLGERYLRGTAEFTSHLPAGTTFRLTIPKSS